MSGPELRVMIGRRIASLRRSTRPRLTQDTLARKVGVSLSYLSKLEIGSKELPLTLAAKIATQLRVPLAALVADIEAPQTEACHRLSLRLCRMVQESGYPVQAVEQAVDAMLKAILAFADHRAR